MSAEPSGDQIPSIPLPEYWAFLSYSHRDNRRDGNRWADWLHDGLERFKVPKELIGVAGRYGEPVPDRLFPVFQDEKELPTNADLGLAIQEALVASRYLVVICSPRAAASRYVNKEVLEFKRLGRANRILAVIIDGEPNASDPKKAMDPTLECFPEALRHSLGADGSLDLDSHVEPIAADVRAADGTEADLMLKAHASVLEREKLRVAAGLLGVGFDDLVQRDNARQLAESRARASRLRKLVAGFATLAIVAVAAGVVAMRARAESVHALSQSDFLEAVQLEPADAAPHLVRSLAGEPNPAALTRLAWLLLYNGWITGAQTLAAVDSIRSAEFSDDGKTVLTASATTLQLWNAETGRPLRAPLVAGARIIVARISPDGGRVAAALANNTVRLWNVASGEETRYPIMHGGEVRYAEFSPDGSRLVTASADSTARVSDATTGLPAAIPLFHKGSVGSARFSLDGRRIVTASEHGARVWNAATGEPLTAPFADGHEVVAASFSADGKQVVTALANGTLSVWSAESGNALGAYTDSEREPKDMAQDAAVGTLDSVNVLGASLTPRGYAVVTFRDGLMRLWNWESGERQGLDVIVSNETSIFLMREGYTGRVMQNSPKYGGPGSTAGTVTTAAFSPGGGRLAVVSRDHSLRIWDAETGDPLTVPITFGSAILSVRFRSDGRRLVTVSTDGSARIWNIDAAQPIDDSPRAFHDWVNSAHFSPDGKRLVTGAGDSTARIWDAASGQSRAEPMKHGGPVFYAEYSSDGRRIATASEDGTARVWSAETGQPLTASLTHASPPFIARFSHDGALLVTASLDRTAQVWNAVTGQPIGPTLGKAAPYELPDGTFNLPDYNVEVARDGSRVMTANPPMVVVWDAHTGQQLTTVSVPRMTVARLSPEGTRIVTASADHTARVWSVATGKQVAGPMTHDAGVLDARFSADGTRIVTTSTDGTARVWDARTGRPLVAPINEHVAIDAARFSADGRRLVTLTNKGKRVSVWDVETSQPLTGSFSPSALGKGASGDGLFLSSADFSPDGSSVLVTSDLDPAHVWDIAPPGGRAPAWLLEMATAVTGRTLNSAGVMQPELREPAGVLDHVRRQLASASTDDWWARLGRWFLADPATRTVSPFSNVAAKVP